MFWPAVGCGWVGSYHTGPQHHPNLCLSGQYCKHRDSCLSRSESLKIKKGKGTFITTTTSFFNLMVRRHVSNLLRIGHVFYHLHQCRSHRHLLHHCCLCQSEQGWAHKGSYHTDPLQHLYHSHTDEDCTSVGSYPESKIVHFIICVVNIQNSCIHYAYFSS